jgi:hypothetical protein
MGPPTNFINKSPGLPSFISPGLLVKPKPQKPNILLTLAYPRIGPTIKILL